MRVLIINNYAHVTGGADLHCLEITEGLRDRGHEVQWLATASPNNIEHSGEFVPLTVTTGNRDDLPLHRRLDAARRAIWNPSAARAMERLADGFRPDVVHVHKAYVQLSVAPIVVAARQRLPLVQTVHDYEFVSASSFDSSGGRWDRDEGRLAYQALNSLTLIPRRRLHRPRITRWIAVSDAVARPYASIGGIECEVIPNFTEASTEPPVPHAGRDGVLFLGRLSREKGIDLLLEAAPMLPEVRFRIAGDGPLRPEVEAAAATLDNVEYLGFVSKDEGRRLMRSSLACVMPSVWEDPGPLACLESMAEGTPVICFAKGGLAEYVTNAEAGIVCGQIDPETLIEAVLRLSSSREEWDRFSENGRAAVAGRHSLPTYLDALENVYRSAMEAGRETIRLSLQR